MNEVVVVGAGPSGIGVSIILQKMGVNFTVLDRNNVGSSFLKWPKQMKLLTPSFFSNTFKMIDLNAITYDTSPALTLADRTSKWTRICSISEKTFRSF